MATNWNLYEARLNINGTTKRERDLNCLQNKITNNLPNSLSCKAVKINGINSSLNFTETKTGYDIQSLPNETFSVGDYIVYKTTTYLVTKVNGDDDVYTSGSMEECNYIIKFQSPTGTILSYPCIDDGSNLSIGVDSNNTISTLNGIKRIKLPFDENTKLIGIDRRFFLDKVGTTTYKVTNVNNTSFSYGDKGLIELTLQQDEYNPLTDKNGVCNYFEPTVVPPTPDPTVPTEIVTITSDAVNNNIKLGLVYTFSATFKNELGVDVENFISQYSINNNYGNLVVLVDNGDGTCTVKVDEEAYDLLTSEVVLTCFDAMHGFSSSVTLTIVGFM